MSGDKTLGTRLGLQQLQSLAMFLSASVHRYCKRRQRVAGGKFGSILAGGQAIFPALTRENSRFCDSKRKAKWRSICIIRFARLKAKWSCKQRVRFREWLNNSQESYVWARWEIPFIYNVCMIMALNRVKYIRFVGYFVVIVYKTYIYFVFI
jgi:hypothetical protein